MAADKFQRRWHQFSLPTLLIAPIVVAFATYWLVQHQKASNARVEFEGKRAAYSAGVAPFREAVNASIRLCKADEAMPFADRVRARALNVARLSDLLLEIKTQNEMGMSGGEADQKRGYDAYLYVLGEYQKAQVELTQAQGR